MSDHGCITDRLPGPPLNVRIEKLDSHTVVVRWDPPHKNPHTVEMYRYEHTILTVLIIFTVILYPLHKHINPLVFLTLVVTLTELRKNSHKFHIKYLFTRIKLVNVL